MTARRPCADCGRNRAERFYRSERGRICLDCQRKTRRTSQRASHVGRTYGLTASEYAALLAHQRGVCAICGGSRRYALDVDHDHATGKVRGLLCKADNKLLAIVRDNPARLLAAAEYLTLPPMQAIEEEVA